MKEIGEKLRETREKMDISLDEASEDLKVDSTLLQKLEEGDKESFKDVLYLKYYIRDYAKYLGLNPDELVEEFNEYLFDYTSKISLDDIKKANKNNKEKEKKEIQIISPYTVERKQQHNIPVFLIYLLIILIVGIIVYCTILFFKNKDNENKNIISYTEEVFYEFA